MDNIKISTSGGGLGGFNSMSGVLVQLMSLFYVILLILFFNFNFNFNFIFISIFVIYTFISIHIHIFILCYGSFNVYWCVCQLSSNGYG